MDLRIHKLPKRQRRVDSVLDKINNNKKSITNLIGQFTRREALHGYSDTNRSVSQLQTSELKNSILAAEKTNVQQSSRLQMQSKMKIRQTPTDISIINRQAKIMRRSDFEGSPLLKRHVREEESPIIRIRHVIPDRDKLKYHPPPQNNQSNLDFDISKFRRSMNGTLLKLSPIKPEQEAINKLHSSRMRKGQAIILNVDKLQQVAVDLTPHNNLVDADYETVKKYLQQHGQLDPDATSNALYEYFDKLCSILQIKFDDLLIKKYKNCLYFGENPASQHTAQYQGFMYHFNIKIYYGQLKNGKKHGMGTEISFRDDIVSRGMFDCGNKVGEFLIIKGTQYQYQGEVSQGLLEGRGILKTKFSKYQGEFKKGFKHGQGQQWFFLTDEVYTGEYENGNFEGRGELKSKDYYYEGQFSENLKQGEGLERTSGQEYRGAFVRGKRCGNGIIYFQNGDIYTGEFRDNHMYGKGEMHYADKKARVRGFFVNGRLVAEQKKQKGSPNKSKSIGKQQNKIYKLTQVNDISITERPIFKSSPRKKQIYKQKKYQFESFQGQANEEIKNPFKYTNQQFVATEKPKFNKYVANSQNSNQLLKEFLDQNSLDRDQILVKRHH